MRKLITLSIILASCVLAVGCNSDVAALNPASEYCVSKGGKLVFEKDKDGNEFAMCHLQDGTVIDEWEFFRKNNPETKE